MSLSFCVRAFFFVLILYPKDGDAKGVDGFVKADRIQRGRLSQARTDLTGEEGTTKLTVPFIWNNRDLEGRKGKRENYDRLPVLTNVKESPSSLVTLATRATEILDRISKKWALEGAKTIQDGEIRLRKLHKDLTDMVEELIANGSSHGQHMQRCMNETIFEAGLYRILDDTTDCYGKSLEAVRKELNNIEYRENSMLQKMESYAMDMFKMLSDCLLKESSSDVIDCLQRVDGINIGKEMRQRETVDVMKEMNGLIGDIPRTFSDCTSKGLVETEAHIRKGYARSLTCLKERTFR